MKISLELLSGSLLKPFPYSGRLVQMTGCLVDVSAESAELSEAVVLVARIDLPALIG